MKRRKSAREVALDVLIAVETRHAYSNLALDHALDEADLSPRDRGLATELVYGTVQRRNTLDWLLDSLLKKGVDSLQPWVRQLLRMGVYQLVYLDRIPARAAVHETVEIAKKRGHRGISGLVNGVLRALLRQPSVPEPPSSMPTVERLAITTSHPEWLVRRMMDVYGEQTAIAILEANNRPPAAGLRVNRLKTDRDTVLKRLKAARPEATVEPSPVSAQAIRYRGGGSPARLPGFEEGNFTIQDEASMLVAKVVAPRPGWRGLDACAAPGGKTTHLAELMDNCGHILACDIHSHKVDLIRDHAARLGISIIEARQADARKLDASQSFDFVLLDAPCSGLGVIRRKPDIKWSKEAENIAPLIALQRELLDAVSRMIRPGGVLVYSTCTLEPRENEEQVQSFLARHPAFRADEQLPRLLPETVVEHCRVEKGMVQLLPHQLDTDGFFIARMIKQK
ncbi:16S rRNA (cytosine(967)-C(5))-methyltransferase RsmB [Polycladomyces sp. WAk]|uniref:16S rRNA (cytosine(967)-C(5))-methyltransferase n=1 Tax=Polycladomyces zharkentensis TaxID=2807616 RepID=A0ABS2WFL7_9BACL|nr:16S rRNA (cytosine(967)-C(5))-methyltransferase RsmB [Polycladomyces sp. WAk]MBN2908303.1 16S rRNA (cytosine(967)-C(5))-methyltransferase RsmB [Polycladomyces sp. WAk]